tara:strand:- start:5482 stop:5928 length:447 start_codon:yes stop_codon:yes gene_type:complete
MLKIIIVFFSLTLFFQNLLADEYFLTLRNDKVNLRQGPSFKHPIKLFYKKKFLPVEISEKSENFRKIRDHENNTGWIHISQLSKKKAAIVIDDNTLIYSGRTIYSKPLAVSKIGKLLLVKRCKENWCKITDSKIKGWVKKESLWGRLN